MLSLEYCEQLVIWVRKNMKEAKMEDDAVVNKVLHSDWSVHLSGSCPR